MADNFFKFFIDDLRVELMDEFDRNFERKAFFNQPWAKEKYPNKRGSLLMRSGALRRSLKASSTNSSIIFSSSVPYAVLQNEGGVLTVTAKMKRYFWAMYYKTSGASSKTPKGKAMSMEASMWKAMALKKVGSKIKIEQRQFISVMEPNCRVTEWQVGKEIVTV